MAVVSSAPLSRGAAASGILGIAGSAISCSPTSMCQCLGGGGLPGVLDHFSEAESQTIGSPLIVAASIGRTLWGLQTRVAVQMPNSGGGGGFAAAEHSVREGVVFLRELGRRGRRVREGWWRGRRNAREFLRGSWNKSGSGRAMRGPGGGICAGSWGMSANVRQGLEAGRWGAGRAAFLGASWVHTAD